MYTKAALAITGQILMFVGSWNLITCEPRSKKDFRCATKGVLSPHHDVQSNMMLAVFGVAIIIVADTFYANVNMDASLNPREDIHPIKWWLTGIWPLQYNWKAKTFRDRCLRGIWLGTRMLLAYIGMMVVWVGVYNLIDDNMMGNSWPMASTMVEQPCLGAELRTATVDACTDAGCPYDGTGCFREITTVDRCYESKAMTAACQKAWNKSNAITLVVGAVLLIITRTYYCMASIFPDASTGQRRPKFLEEMNLKYSWSMITEFYRAFPRVHGRRCLEAVIALFGKNMIWVGMINLMFAGTLKAGVNPPSPHPLS
jgi:hypothetical protein